MAVGVSEVTLLMQLDLAAHYESPLKYTSWKDPVGV